MKRCVFPLIRLVQDNFLAPVISVLFPADCPVCLEPLARYHSGGICLSCWASIKVIRKPLCPKCGLPLYEPRIMERTNLPVNGANVGLCGRCQAKKYHFSSARALGEYSGSLKEIIGLYKFGKNSHLALPLSRFLMKAIEGDAAFKTYCSTADTVIAVPLHRKRRRQRGFNQSFLIASEIGKQLQLKVERRVLFRAHDSIPQSELPASKREVNVKGKFGIRNARRIKGKKILLIDDIFTTGATVSECAKVLKQGGAVDVSVLTIAHTPLSPA